MQIWPIDHVHLAVKDLHESVYFYTTVLGFEAEIQGRTAALKPRGAARPLIYLEARDLPAGEENYIYHIAIRQPDRVSLGAMARRVMEMWDFVEGFADHLVSEAIYVRDPDGIGIEIYRDRDTAEWRWAEGQVIMDTLPLDIRSLLAEGRGSGGVHKDAVIGHIHLRVVEPERAARFYAEKFGLAVTARWHGAYFLAIGRYHHHLAFNNWRIQPPLQGAGIIGFALRGVAKAHGEEEKFCGAFGGLKDP